MKVKAARVVDQEALIIEDFSRHNCVELRSDLNMASSIVLDDFLEQKTYQNAIRWLKKRYPTCPFTTGDLYFDIQQGRDREKINENEEADGLV